MHSYSAELVEAGLPFIDKAKMVHRFDPGLIRQLPRVPSFKKLGGVAVEMIEQRGLPFAFVTGPMRSGPRGYVGNARCIDRVCDWLANPDAPHPFVMPVFYQLVLQVEIHRIRDMHYVGREDDFIHDLCEQISRPVLEHKLLKTLVVMPDFHQSEGSLREYKIFLRRPDRHMISVRRVEKMNIPGLAELLSAPAVS